jgi:hypothetical protein
MELAEFTEAASAYAALTKIEPDNPAWGECQLKVRPRPDLAPISPRPRHDLATISPPASRRSRSGFSAIAVAPPRPRRR